MPSAGRLPDFSSSSSSSRGSVHSQVSSQRQVALQSSVHQLLSRGKPWVQRLPRPLRWSLQIPGSLNRPGLHPLRRLQIPLTLHISATTHMIEPLVNREPAGSCRPCQTAARQAVIRLHQIRPGQQCCMWMEAAGTDQWTHRCSSLRRHQPRCSSLRRHRCSHGRRSGSAMQPQGSRTIRWRAWMLALLAPWSSLPRTRTAKTTCHGRLCLMQRGASRAASLKEALGQVGLLTLLGKQPWPAGCRSWGSARGLSF